MIKSDVIIVGGGPAGSSCAWQLKRNGADCIILEKKKFPRTKLCAGWITPKVLHDLELNISDYPHKILTFPGLHVSVHGFKFKAPTSQHSIRRYEFDHWLLQRSKTKVYTHDVKIIKQKVEGYYIDDKFQSKYLVGAAGTFCPVYLTFFQGCNPRAKENLIVTLEEEFEYNYSDNNCYLWFLENDLPGYSWYVPKENGFLNVGIGGSADKLKKKNQNIKMHWEYLIQKLNNQVLVKNHSFKPKGCSYYHRDNVRDVQNEDAYIIGDAAGLATLDMGEGIGPAIESGILAANAILNGEQYTVESILKYSIKYRSVIKLLDIFLKFRRIKNKNSN